MASLTEISVVSRRLIRYGFYAIILIIIARFSLNLGVKIYKKVFPPKPEPPTVAFGKLPALPFPEQPEMSLNYTLELPEGSLPTLVDKVAVYRMPEPQTNIKALDNAKDKAEGLGFNPNGKPLFENIPNIYIFTSNKSPSTLTMNIVTNLFSISYNINEDPTVTKGVPPSAETAISQAQAFLTRGDLLAEDLEDGNHSHEYLKIASGKFVSAVSLSDAEVTKANIFRKPYGRKEDINPVTPKMPQANVWFMIAGGRGKQIIAGEYHYFAIDSSKPATYPIIASQTAWEELQAGKAYIANPGDSSDGSITIRKVYLGYYDAGQYAEYYQPVVVFEGDNGFYAYVPAVTSEFYPK